MELVIYNVLAGNDIFVYCDDVRHCASESILSFNNHSHRLVGGISPLRIIN
jgi:hypothetical protein